MTGLAILLPVVITILVLQFIVNFLTEPFIGMITPLLKYFHVDHYGTSYLPPDKLLKYTSKACILVLLFLFTILIGIVTRWFFIRIALNLWDRLLHKIPVIKTIYKTTQDIIKTLFSPDEHSFQQVVLVPFPKENIYALGLISRDSPASCSQKVGAKLISVLIPTTPNPTTGFLLMYKQEDMIYIDMKPEDAIKYIVSCGMIVPANNAKGAK